MSPHNNFPPTTWSHSCHIFTNRKPHWTNSPVHSKFETLAKETFCNFPHRHGDATGKPETRNETRGCKKTSISCETSANFDIFHMLSNRLECHKVPCLPRKTTWQPAWKHSKRTRFPASPIDTATPQENERLATRHVDAEKPAFPTRLPPILKFCEHHQTGWNVRKCHVCHAKRHDNLLGHIRIGDVFQLPL